MIAPFLTTLNIALHSSKSPAGGIAYLALPVRDVDLLNTFIFALGGQWPFFFFTHQSLTVLIQSKP